MRFRIRWDGDAYRVSIPNYDGGDVITAEVTDEMVEAAWTRWRFSGIPQGPDRMRAALDAALLTDPDPVAT